MWAFVNKSAYQDINKGVNPVLSFSRNFYASNIALYGFSIYGCANYPVVGKNAEFNLYTKK